MCGAVFLCDTDLLFLCLSQFGRPFSSSSSVFFSLFLLFFLFPSPYPPLSLSLSHCTSLSSPSLSLCLTARFSGAATQQQLPPLIGREAGRGRGLLPCCDIFSILLLASGSVSEQETQAPSRNFSAAASAQTRVSPCLKPNETRAPTPSLRETDYPRALLAFFWQGRKEKKRKLKADFFLSLSLLSR